MKSLFVFEYICGGGLSQAPLDTGLTREGGAMLAATVADGVAAGLRVTSMLDRRVPLQLTGAEVTSIASGEPHEPVFDRLARTADAVLVIAPEFEGLLVAYAVRLEMRKIRSLGCGVSAIGLCADKLATAEHLDLRGISTPTTWLGLRPAVDTPVVVKPRWGAGCEDTYILQPNSDIEQLPDRTDWITQLYAPGRAVSASFLVRGGEVVPLRAGEQRIEGQGKLAYSGGHMPLRGDAARRAMALGRQAVESVEGLSGYVGVDLVLGEKESDDTVIEINPRITVAYVGLRRLCETNLVAAMMDPTLPIEWKKGDMVVDYDSAGGAREFAG